MTPVQLGLRANARQFALLVLLNGFVGAMVGVERSVLPLVGERDFGLDSHAAILSFVVAFGIAKAGANLAAGALAEGIGRRRLLLAGWGLAFPVPLLVAVAPSWELVVLANLFLGASQGLAWSMTVVMKIDLAGPRRRGLALGLNESFGYLGVAIAAAATGAVAAAAAPRTVVWTAGLVVAVIGFSASLLVRDTRPHAELEQGGRAASSGLRAALVRGTLTHPVLRTCAQAGLVNNLNDALAWGLVPLYLASNGAGVREIGAVAAVYPAVWAVGQIATGWLSDIVGRRPLITLGMLVQAIALGLLGGTAGDVGAALVAAALLGIGTALVYPTLLAAVADALSPLERASGIGVYRFWRDSGFVVGAVLAGATADALGASVAIAVVAALTAASGAWVAATSWPTALPSGGPMRPIGTRP